MKSALSPCSVLLLLLAYSASFGQDAVKEDPVPMLIEQLGSDEFAKRETAEERLVELGGAAVEALRAASKSTDKEIVFRSQRALKRITELSPEDQANLRNAGQAAFYAGDYDQMVRCYRRLFQVQNASIDDGRWLGHAYQLSSQWKEAAAAYSAVIDRMDPLLDRGPEKDFPGSTNWPTGNGNALQERAAIIMLTARIQRYYLKDPVAAEKTLRRVYRSHDILNEPLDALAEKRRAGIAAAIEAGKDVSSVEKDINFHNSLRFPLMALRELADVQQVNGNQMDALESWRRIHLTTSLCMGSTPSVDAPAIDRLIQELPAEAGPSIPGVTILDIEHPTAEFNLASAAILVKSYDIRQNNASFALSAEKGQEFESLEFTCDIEQFEPQYGGQFDCWALVGEEGKSRKGIGYIFWPTGKPVGRDNVTKKFPIEPGTGLVHFSAGTWKGKFKVHSVQVTATFRPRAKDLPAAAKPIPGFSFHTEFLPKGGTITINGQPYGNETTTHNVQPGPALLEYAHPQLKEPRKFSLDLKPGASYSLFVNLDSPLTGELTNLRGFHAQYGPCTNIVPMKDGRWLAAWAGSGGLKFASSGDLVTWSEPTGTSDSQLFNENYTCLSPTLHADKEGTLWVVYFSNQLDIDQLNTGGYRMFLRSSKDGREWSAPRPLKMPLDGWPPGNVQLLTGPNGKTWMFYRLQYAVADSPAGISDFQNLDVPVTEVQRSHARNPHATFDAAGRLHLVWDHFGQTMYYAQRNAEGRWSEPLDIAEKGPNQRASHPQLLLRDDKIALIYTVNQSAHLRRGELQDGSPRLGEPLKLAPHTAQLISALPLLTADDRVVFLTGANTVWKQTGSVKAILGASKD